MALKVAIVGMGGIGNTHARAYVNDPLAELVAVCDVNKEKADKAAAEYGVPAFYSEEEMFKAMPEIQSVSVCTSGYENGSHHFDAAMTALGYGKHVLCEKPICNDITDARKLVAYANEQKLYLACDLNHYFTKTSDKAKQLISDGKIGEPVYLLQKMGFNGGDATYNSLPSPRWLTPFSHMKAFLAHPFSIMRYFGGNISHIQCFCDRPGVRRTAGDPMLSINSIHMKFENGGFGYIISQRGVANFGLGGWWCFEMSGTKGAFCIENCTEKLHYWPGPEQSDGGMTTPEPQLYDTGIKDFGATFPVRIHAYLEDVTNGVPRDYLRANGRDALATLEYTYAAMESYENGGELVRPAALPPLHGDPEHVW